VKTVDKIKYFLQKFFKWVLLSSGSLFLVSFILSFTNIPYYAYHYLGTCNAELYYKPNVIVLLGGGGMPSPDGLLRSYYAAEAANEYKDAKVVIALPYNQGDSTRQLRMMARELVIRGIDSSRIEFEAMGFNTHSQAEHISRKYAGKKNVALLLITSPEHMYRAVKTFKTNGFTRVGGVPTFEKPPDEEKVKDKQETSDPRIKNLSLRYNMWSYLNYELLVLKEYCAISYYKVKGWM